MPNHPAPSSQPGLRVALVHDWLVTLRGGERVLDGLCELFPDATLHTLVRIPGVATPRIEAAAPWQPAQSTEGPSLTSTLPLMWFSGLAIRPPGPAVSA